MIGMLRAATAAQFAEAHRLAQSNHREAAERFIQAGNGSAAGVEAKWAAMHKQFVEAFSDLAQDLDNPPRQFPFDEIQLNGPLFVDQQDLEDGRRVWSISPKAGHLAGDNADVEFRVDLGAKPKEDPGRFNSIEKNQAEPEAPIDRAHVYDGGDWGMNPDVDFSALEVGGDLKILGEAPALEMRPARSSEAPFFLFNPGGDIRVVQQGEEIIRMGRDGSISVNPKWEKDAAAKALFGALIENSYDFMQEYLRENGYVRAVDFAFRGRKPESETETRIDLGEEEIIIQVTRLKKESNRARR